jgi:uncharacterized protein YggL (DUF469 family)
MNLCFAGMTALFLSGCVTAKTESWSNPDYKGQSIGKTIVLATFEDNFINTEYEVMFAENLLDFVSAASMHQDVKNLDQMDKKSVGALLKQNQVKTLIVTHQVSAVDRSQLVPYGVSYQAYGTGSDSFYTYCGSYQFDNQVDSFMENAIETTVFDVDSGTLVWSGIKEVYDFNSKRDNMKKVIRDIIRDLEKEGMLKR